MKWCYGENEFFGVRIEQRDDIYFAAFAVRVKPWWDPHETADPETFFAKVVKGPTLGDLFYSLVNTDQDIKKGQDFYKKGNQYMGSYKFTLSSSKGIKKTSEGMKEIEKIKKETIERITNFIYGAYNHIESNFGIEQRPQQYTFEGIMEETAPFPKSKSATSIWKIPHEAIQLELFEIKKDETPKNYQVELFEKTKPA